MQIDLNLKYPLHIRRYGNGQITIVDMAWNEVATATNYDQVWEIVTLANSAYKLMHDLTRKRPYENTPKTPRNLGLTEAERGISDPAGTDSP